MRNRLTLGVLVLAAVAFVASGPAAAQTLSTGTTGATMVAAVTISQDQELNFGGFVPQVSGGGTIVVTPAGARSRTGTGQLDGGIPGTQAIFTINSTAFANWSVLLSGATALTGPGTPMSVALALPSPVSGLFVAGTATFSVGGTLTVADNQTEGVYAGTYTVSVTTS